MSDTYCIDEIRQTRERFAKECGNDLRKIMEWARQTVRDLGFAET